MTSSASRRTYRLPPSYRLRTEQLVMPPLEPLDPPEGDVIPNPGSVLILGDNRWLSMHGRILSEALGYEVGLEANTLNYWEDAAQRATGKPLSDLIV
jgi:hypothetical protein